MRAFILKIIFLFCLSSGVALAGKAPESLQVMVSIAPYIDIVQKIGKDHVEVLLVVPQGADSHNFEPTLRQIQQAAKSKIWFTIGEAFEKKMQDSLQEENKELVICDLRQGLHLHHESCAHHAGGLDPHIWMSPHLMLIQAETIKSALEKALPLYKEEFEKNLHALQEELKALDEKMKKLFANTSLTVLVAHPAYGYFCSDYGIKQLAIEHEGKDPTAKQLTQLLKTVKKLQIKKIFVQNQYSHKGAELIAQEIGAKIVVLNPYSAHYFEMITEIGQEFCDQTPAPQAPSLDK
jgi:zinc transport system substrate-binding protein